MLGPEDLTPLLEHVAAMYDRADDEEFHETDLISTLLQDDWELFSERLSGVQMQELATAILGERQYSDLFVRKHRLDLSIADLFYLRAEPTDGANTSSPPSDQGIAEHGLPDSVSFAIEDLGRTYPCSRTFYRARPYPPGRTTPFAPSELGAPPPGSTLPAARGNRTNQPVLYVATNATTALAEKRARPGDFIGLACVRLLRPQRVLDLAHLPYVKDPFFEEDLRWKTDALHLLRTLGDELSRPLADEDPPDKYAISHEACDAIRGAGFDGVAYPSSLGPGHNVFFFDPIVGRVTRRRVVQCRPEAPGFAVVDRPSAP